MGKSTAARLLETAGVAVVDTDDLARLVVEPGQPALEEIREAFGAEMVRPDGWLDRERLAARVFTDTVARVRLEAITHPHIRELWEKRLRDWEDSGRTVGVVVVPLLFEVGLERLFDRIVCVACSEPTQHRRLEQRGWSEAERRRRLGAQWPPVRKMERAQQVIWTEGSMEIHARQWRVLLRGAGLLQASLEL